MSHRPGTERLRIFSFGNRNVVPQHNLFIFLPFLRSSVIVAHGLCRVLCLFGKVSAGAADSHYRSLWSFQFIITLRACIFLQVIRAVLFSRFHFFSAAGNILKQTETVSDHCRFPYFLPICGERCCLWIFDEE